MQTQMGSYPSLIWDTEDLTFLRQFPNMFVQTPFVHKGLQYTGLTSKLKSLLSLILSTFGNIFPDPIHQQSLQHWVVLLTCTCITFCGEKHMQKQAIT